MSVDSYTFVCNDQGTSACDDVSLWSPNCPEGWWILGEMGSTSLTLPPSGRALLVQVSGSPSSPTDPYPIVAYLNEPPTYIPNGSSGQGSAAPIPWDFARGTGHLAYEFRGFGIFQPTSTNPGYVPIGIWGARCFDGIDDPFNISANTRAYYVYVWSDYLTQVPSSSLTKLYDNGCSPVVDDFSLWTLPNSGCIVASPGSKLAPNGPLWDILPINSNDLVKWDNKSTSFVTP